MMNCKQATRKLEKLKEDRLNMWETISLRLHLMMCKYCKRFHSQWEYLEKNFNSDPGVVLNEEKKSELKNTIDHLK